GCRFSPRCPYATDVCTTTPPELVEATPGHWYACHHPVGSERWQEVNVRMRNEQSVEAS
ncbi:MAG: oligopeptide/dipeptide ABC transporter ATP-binding protein, partial [Ilumatobacteraceae bacterium]